MRSEDGCETRLLVNGGECRVHRCDHGTIHLTLGAFTIRLTTDQLVNVATALRLAVERLPESPAEESPPQGRLLC